MLHSKKGVLNYPDIPCKYPLLGVWTLDSQDVTRHGVEMPALCSFACLTLDLLLSHLNSQHSHDTLNIKCRFDSCGRDYIKINSFVKHVRDKHRAHLFDSEQSNGTGILGE